MPDYLLCLCLAVILLCPHRWIPVYSHATSMIVTVHCTTCQCIVHGGQVATSSIVEQGAENDQLAERRPLGGYLASGGFWGKKCYHLVEHRCTTATGQQGRHHLRGCTHGCTRSFDFCALNQLLCRRWRVVPRCLRCPKVSQMKHCACHRLAKGLRRNLLQFFLLPCVVTCT